jgi:prophage regulatory protein
LALLPISKSAWWKGISERRYPAPVRIGARMVAWRAEEIHALIDHGILPKAGA